VFIDKVGPVVVDLFEASIVTTPIGVLVFGERVPMGADVTGTALSKIYENEALGAPSGIG